MTKAPLRPVSKPAGSGALPLKQPRGPDGQFVKRDIAAKAALPETPAPEKSAPSKRAATPEQLVGRVTRAIERELTQIEEIVGGARSGASKRTDAEKRARTLASLARTLAEVTRLRSAANDAKADHDDDAGPRNLDEFRRELERRLTQIADPPEVVPDRGDDAA